VHAERRCDAAPGHLFRAVSHTIAQGTHPARPGELQARAAFLPLGREIVSVEEAEAMGPMPV